VRLWDPVARRQIARLEGHQGSVESVAFSPDGGLLASGGNDAAVRLWDPAARREIARLEGHEGVVWSVAFSSDGSLLASGGADGTVCLWEPSERREIACIQGRQGLIRSVAFSPDGGLLASGGTEGTVRLWQIPDGSPAGLLLGGTGANWLSIDAGGTLRRGDDGTLLVLPDKRGELKPINGDDWRLGSAPEVKVQHPTLSIAPGTPTLLAVSMRNPGPEPLYWLHLEQSSPNGLIRPATANDNIAELQDRKGEQPWYPERIAHLDPGETAILYTRLYARLPLPTPNWIPGPRKLELNLVSANAKPTPITVDVDLELPRIRWRTGKWDRNSETLEVALADTGNLPLETARVSAEWWETTPPPGRTRRPDFQSPWQELPQIEPGSEGRLAFILPDGSKYLDSGTLTLCLHTLDLPIFDWRLPAPAIERVGLVLWWLLAPLLLALLAVAFDLRCYRHPLVVQLSRARRPAGPGTGAARRGAIAATPHRPAGHGARGVGGQRAHPG
jgi:hypothetical protein